MRNFQQAAGAFILTAMLVLSIAAWHGAAGEEAAGDVADRDAIAAVIDIYIEGGRKGSGDIMKKAFHDGATIYSAAGGGPIQRLFDLVDGKPPANDIPYAIANLDITGDIAMVRVEIDNWSGTRYTDMFTLLKTGDGWRIVNKVSHRH